MIAFADRVTELIKARKKTNGDKVTFSIIVPITDEDRSQSKETEREDQDEWLVSEAGFAAGAFGVFSKCALNADGTQMSVMSRDQASASPGPNSPLA